VPGPGLLNATAALATAYACNQPVLCVTGQIQSDRIEQGFGQLHEIPNQLGMIRSVTKYAERAVTPEAIPGAIDRAITSMWDGRVRPVEVEIPPDTLFATGDVAFIGKTRGRVPVPVDPDAVESAAKLLGNSQTPVIFVGGGVHGSEAWDELRELAELLQAPVIATQNGRGALSDHHYLSQSQYAGKALLAEADVVFAVGTRFSEATSFSWGIKPGKTFIQLDIDADMVGKAYPATVGLTGDAKMGLAALIDAIPAHNRSRASREDEMLLRKQEANAAAASVLPQAEYAGAIRQALPEDGIFVGEMTQIGYYSNMAFPVYQPRTYLTPGYQGTLGWGFPTSLGVKVGAPDKVVMSINGDGGFGFCLNELATQAQHGIASITLVFNDGAFGNVRRIQQEQFDGRTIASDLRNPNYVKLAEAFGVTGRRTDSPAGLATHLDEAIKANEPTLIEIQVSAMPHPWRALGLR
jgi:acetolactate synthase-1/2/3 large subunit